MTSRSIVLDTNVLISAALKEKSVPARLLVHALDRKLVLMTCPAVVAEYVAVLHRPKFARWGFPPEWFERLLGLALHADRDPPEWPLAGPDRDDLVFLALAKQQGATLVTGNVRDYPVSIRRGAELLPPADYLSWLEAAL